MGRTRLLALVILGACGASNPPPDGTPNPPDQNDPAFSVSGLRNWYLVADNVTAGDDEMTMTITAPNGTSYVDAYIGDWKRVRMTSADGAFSLDTSIADLAAGDYTLLFSANGSTDAFAAVPIHRSNPYYVMVSTDYDFSDPGTQATMYMDSLHHDHPGMRITHFWAPYTYTDPAVTDQRRAELDTWILAQRDTYNDEIGLHIHPYCNFVTDAGITCITDQSDVYPTGDTSGYTIMLGAYGRDNFSILLQHAKALFAAHNLGEPKTFRAGGWTATSDTLAALQDNGYIADTSALNWKYIQFAWHGHEIASWTMTQWAPINDTSQPYYPSQSVVSAADPGPNYSLLEVPDNGVMIDYTTLAQVTHIFDANFDGQHALTASTTMMMGFHPSTNFSADEYMRVDGFLKYSDQHLHETDKGPVVYTTLSDVTPAFPPL